MNEFRVLNDKGDIEVKILKPANAVFQTDEFHVDSTVTVYKNAFNIFDLVFENKQLKERIEYLERSNNRREDNWNKLKKWLEKELGDRINPNKDKWLTGVYDAYWETIDKMKELEQGSDE